MPDDYITLWHTKGPTACGERAFSIRPYIIDTNAHMRAEDAFHRPVPGTEIKCESCGGRMPINVRANVSVYVPKPDWRQRRWEVDRGM